MNGRRAAACSLCGEWGRGALPVGAYQLHLYARWIILAGRKGTICQMESENHFPVSSGCSLSESPEREGERNSLPECETSKTSDQKHTDLPSGKPCASGAISTAPPNASDLRSWTWHYGTLILFRARMELAGKTAEFKKLQKSLLHDAGSASYAETLAAERMGCGSYEDEKAFLYGLRTTDPELVGPTEGEMLLADEQRSVSIKDDLFEALNKSHKEELRAEAFLRPGAYIWYRLSQEDPSKFCSLVAQHVLKSEVGTKLVKDEEVEQAKEDESKSLEELERMLAGST